jgi:hypothetical protein
MSKELKGIFSGEIAQDADQNYYCGPYLLDFQTVKSGFKIGDIITIISVMANKSDKSYNQYPQKTKNFKIKES